MPKAYPREFRDDVVAVAQRREPGVTIKQIADEFGISEGCLQNWLRQWHDPDFSVSFAGSPERQRGWRKDEHHDDSSKEVP